MDIINQSHEVKSILRSLQRGAVSKNGTMLFFFSSEQSKPHPYPQVRPPGELPALSVMGAEWKTGRFLGLDQAHDNRPLQLPQRHAHVESWDL